MSIIVEFRVRSPDLVMSETLQSMPSMKLDLIQEVGTNPEQPYLLFWAYGGDLDEFESRLDDDETVENIQTYSKMSGRVLYRVRITEAVEVVSYPMWVEIGAEQIQSRWVDGWWSVRMRLPDRNALGVIEEWCTDNDVEFELESIYTHQGLSTTGPELTEEQREILQIALKEGYFEVPREGNLADIADELDISSQAASERLRRGHKRLIKQQL